MTKSESEIIDLTDVEDFTYSAFVRKCRKKFSEQDFLEFLKIFKSKFDIAVSKNLIQPDKIALSETLIIFNKTIHPIKINKNIIKNAAVAELGSPEQVGQYLAGMIKFIVSRISIDNRSNSLNNLKDKINKLDIFDIANKKMPASASLGQSINLIKNILFGHDARYIKFVLDSIVKNI